MKKIALTAAAVLIGMGTAFAGSDHYGAANNQATSVDALYTGSVSKAATSMQPLGSNRVLFGR